MLRARRFDETLLAHSELVTGVFHVAELRVLLADAAAG